MSSGTPAPEMPPAVFYTDAPFPLDYSENIQIGMTYYAWVRARKDAEITDWADVVSVDVK